MKIIVLYNLCSVNRSLYPAALRYVGVHLPMKKIGFYGNNYDYATVKVAFDISDRE